jgi:hypothetical protein
MTGEHIVIFPAAGLPAPEVFGEDGRVASLHDMLDDSGRILSLFKMLR